MRLFFLMLMIIMIMQGVAMDVASVRDMDSESNDDRRDTVIPISSLGNQNVSFQMISEETLMKTKSTNLSEDVPGCMDNYFRFMRYFWMVAEGWVDFTAIATGSVSTCLVVISTQGNLEEDGQQKLGLAATILGGTSVCLQALKIYSMKATSDNTKKLRQVIDESHGVDVKL